MITHALASVKRVSDRSCSSSKRKVQKDVRYKVLIAEKTQLTMEEVSEDVECRTLGSLFMRIVFKF